MQNEITPSGLILPRDDDPPFFNEMRIRHNDRIIWRLRLQASISRIKKIFGR